jgi:hypothetical protein
MAFVRQMTSAGVHLAAVAEADRCSPAQAAALAVLARSLNHMRGIEVLILANQIVEARIITRCLFESLFLAVALKEDSEKTWKKLEADFHFGRRSRGRILAANATADAAAQIEQVKAYMQKMQAELEKPEMLKPKNLAEQTSVAEAYIVFAQLSGDSSHATLDALQRHLVSDDEGKPSEMRLDPSIDEDETVETVTWACTAMLGIMVAIRDLTDAVGASEELDAVCSAFLELTQPAASTGSQ